MRKFCMLLLLPAFLAGCNGEKTNSVEYYTEHKDERAAKLEECRNNPGELKHTPNCVNAAESAHKAMFDPNNSNMPSIR
ncbi:EexN family lipoprotein [Brucella cytisi]|uniref:EexN family lipoprotein n=1 Tax=Brucella cytisi TaxID=407152 RepID=A0A1J6HCK0_9HYPH|nr:EexN family lipoprotein [Brucella cytisi]OIS90313.1 hypothetical protein BLA27_27485 [Brucella cytisi]